VADSGFVALAFTRGAQLAELVAHDPMKNELHFYLARFTQACNAAAGGCGAGDLFTQAVESGWTDVTVYEDEDLRNTIFDCQHCHQPNGPGTRKILRMQELRAPWTHWLRNNLDEPGGRELLADYQKAHDASEAFAGIPGNLIGTPRCDPAQLEALVSNNSVAPQPNEFPTGQVETQVAASAPMQPAQNLPMGTSPAWAQVYQRAVSGQAIAVPYHDVKVTDAAKLDTLAMAYREVTSGARPRSALPSLSGVFLDAALSDMGFAPKPGLDGKGLLVQMCQGCHAGNVDPALSRAKFDATRLDAMSRAEKDLAIARLKEPPDSVRRMPPVSAGSLSSDEVGRLSQLFAQ
jgi:hypothetical protein